MDFTRPFRSDPLRHEGVRPVNIWGLRLFYFLMLVFVAYPLWQAGTLWGTPSGKIASSFLGLPLLALVIPWGYAWRTYVLGSQPRTLLAPSPVPMQAAKTEGR